jgi:hypothetical protein
MPPQEGASRTSHPSSVRRDGGHCRNDDGRRGRGGCTADGVVGTRDGTRNGTVHARRMIVAGTVLHRNDGCRVASTGRSGTHHCFQQVSNHTSMPESMVNVLQNAGETESGRNTDRRSMIAVAVADDVHRRSFLPRMTRTQDSDVQTKSE